MRLYHYISLLIVLLITQGIAAQCVFDHEYYTSVTPPANGSTTISCIYPATFVEVYVVECYEYTFSTCGYSGFDSEITVLDSLFFNVVAHNDDFCGRRAEVTFTAPYTGFVYMLMNESVCDDDDPDCIDMDITSSLIADCHGSGGGGGGGGGGNQNGCNTDVILCQNTAGPFDFGVPGPDISSCLDWYPNSQFTYIMVNITTTGPLSLLIDGDADSGFLDVSVFNIPTGIDPCLAIQDLTNEIGCNYAAAFSGCNQFGFEFPCPSSVPAPDLVAGQTIMIVVEDWQNGPSSNFNLQLGPPPNAQSGPADADISNNGPYCLASGPLQLLAADMGGTWTGNFTSPEGLFDPSAAGLGLHHIEYSIGSAECVASGATDVEIIDEPVANADLITPFVCYGGEAIIEFSGTPNADVEFMINGNEIFNVHLDNSGFAAFSYTGVTTNLNIEFTSVSIAGNPICLVPLSLPDASIGIATSSVFTTPVYHR